jgi:transcriptional pleiotropic regulator of transition state genes
MKSSSSRHIDNLGRIVLPIGIRRALDIHEGDLLDIYLEDGRAIVEKTQTACCFCGSNKDLTAFGGKQICGTCLEKLKNI